MSDDTMQRMQDVADLVNWVREEVATGEQEIRDWEHPDNDPHVAVYAGWLDTRRMPKLARQLLVDEDSFDMLTDEIRSWETEDEEVVL